MVNETFIIGVVYIINFYLNIVILTLHEKLNMSHSTARLVLLWDGLVWYNIVSGFLLPVVVLLRNCREMDEFYSFKSINRSSANDRSFEMKCQGIQPRRPEVVGDCSASRRVSRVFFIKTEDKRKSFSSEIFNGVDNDSISGFSLSIQPPSLPTVE